MTNQVKLVFLLTFVIHLISTLSYAVRIAGVRTGRIAVSFAASGTMPAGQQTVATSVPEPC